MTAVTDRDKFEPLVPCPLFQIGHMGQRNAMAPPDQFPAQRSERMKMARYWGTDNAKVQCQLPDLSRTRWRSDDSRPDLPAPR